MNKCVGAKTPYLASEQNLCAVKLKICQHRTRTEGNEDSRQNRDRDVQTNQHRRHVDGIPAHPRDWAIIIGGGHSEHARNKQPAF